MRATPARCIIYGPPEAYLSFADSPITAGCTKEKTGRQQTQRSRDIDRYTRTNKERADKKSVLRPVIPITGRGGRHGGIAIAHPTDTVVTTALNQAEGRSKADSTLGSSRAAPHPSTNRALRRLTSEVRRDPVYSTRYGRQRSYLRTAAKTT